METQRQWNGLAIARWTPALMGLFSLVTVLAHEQSKQQKLSVRRSAWYAKENPTFSDALASVRRELWTWSLFCTCPLKAQVQEIQGAFLRRFSAGLCPFLGGVAEHITEASQ